MPRSSSNRGRDVARGAAIVAFAAGSALAADPQPQLVKDVHPGVGGSAPNALTKVNGALFFVADDGVHGPELWKSDGTDAGTILVKDINPGAAGSSISSDVEAIGGILYFTADDGTHGSELWRSDGTEAGTFLVREFGLDTLPGEVTQLVDANGRLFFSAIDTASGPDAAKGRELYSSDGTAAGTLLMADLYAGTNGSTPNIFATVGGTVFFDGQEDSGRRGIWKSDGTALGTVFVKDLNPAIGSLDIVNLTNLNANSNGTFFFVGNDGTTGPELWKSDGTTAGTVLVKEIHPGAIGSAPSFITFMDGVAYFSASDGTTGGELWKSDGTAAGTVLVKDIRYLDSSGPTYLTVANGKLYFAANDGAVFPSLWESDGTEAGTVRVSTVFPIGSVSTGFVNANGKLYFEGVEFTNGEELWSSDRTSAGTTILADIYPGATGSQPRYLTVVGDTLYFQADDGVHGSELWKLALAAAPPPPGTGSGTVGTILEIRGAGFGARKGRVETSFVQGKRTRRLALKVLDWSDTVVHASVRGGFGVAALCDVTVVPKKGAKQVRPAEFQFLAPTITAASPSPSPVPWERLQTITLSGQAFGTLRGTVTASWSVGTRTVAGRCKVVAWPTTAAGGGDGPGDVVVRLPKSFKWSSTGTALTLKNKVGSAVWTVP